MDTLSEAARALFRLHVERMGKIAVDASNRDAYRELDAAGIHHNHTPGEGITSCYLANSLHHDLTAEIDQFKALCLALIAAGRKAATFTKGRTRGIVPEAEALGCLAVPEATICNHQRCAAPV